MTLFKFKFKIFFLSNCKKFTVWTFPRELTRYKTYFSELSLQFPSLVYWFVTLCKIDTTILWLSFQARQICWRAMYYTIRDIKRNSRKRISRRRREIYDMYGQKRMGGFRIPSWFRHDDSCISFCRSENRAYWQSERFIERCRHLVSINYWNCSWHK